MRYLALSSLLFLLVGCAPLHRDLQPLQADPSCLQGYVPNFSSALYKAQVEVIGKHLSGLLLVKKMPDSSTRVLFTSEFGVTFFDMGLAKDGSFKIYHVLKQMNRKAVIKTLKKDFEMILMNSLTTEPLKALSDKKSLFFTYSKGKDNYYYVSDLDCKQLLYIERSTKTEQLVVATMLHYEDGIPDSIEISHKNFNFNICLKHLAK